MKKAQCTKAFASMLIVFSLSLSFSQAEAFAVKQSDLDWIEQQLETLSIQREESQAKVDELQNRQASVLEQKAALDERNQYTQKQIDLINEQLALISAARLTQILWFMLGRTSRTFPKIGVFTR